MDIISKQEETSLNGTELSTTTTTTTTANNDELKSIVIENPNETLSSTNKNITSTTKSTTTGSLFSNSTYRSKRNSDSYDTKELNIFDLETNPNKRSSLQLPNNNTASFMKSPSDSPSKNLARNLSLSLMNSIKKSSRPSSAQFSTVSSSSSSSINNSTNKLQESTQASVPPSPHYTVRRNEILFPSNTPAKQQQQQEDLYEQQQQQQFQQSIQYRHNDSYEDYPAGHLFQDILDNPSDKISKKEIIAILHDLFPFTTEETLDRILDQIPFDEYGFVANNEMARLIQQHNITDGMDEVLDDHPINNLQDYENNKNSMSIINPTTTPTTTNLSSSNHSRSSIDSGQYNNNNNNHQIIQPNTKQFGQYSIALDSGDFEGIGTNGVYKQPEEYQLLQDEIIQLKKDLQIYKDNESNGIDIRGKNKKLEEENQKLYTEIKRLEEENNKSKKELSNSKDIEKKRKDLLTEVEEYKKNEIDLIKKNDEFKKQISTLKNLNKEEKQKINEIEKINVELVSKNLELENKLKTGQNRQNILQQQYETLCINLSKFEEEEAQRKRDEDEKQKQTLLQHQLYNQQQQLKQDEIQSSKNITNIGISGSNNSDISTNELFKQSQLFDQKNFSISNDQHHKELIKKIETLESDNSTLQDQNNKLKINNNELINQNNELKTSSSSLEALHSNLKQQFENLIKNNNNNSNNNNNNINSSSSNNNNNNSSSNNNISNQETIYYNKLSQQNESFKSIIQTKNEQIKQLNDYNSELHRAYSNIQNDTSDLKDNLNILIKTSNANKNVKQQQEQLKNNNNNNNQQHMDQDDNDSDVDDSIGSNISFFRKLFNKVELFFAIFGVLVFIIFTIAFISRLNQRNLLIERPS